MSYEELMARVAREIPELAGKLSAPRVTYVRSVQKTYITFESAVLAGEKQFLRLEKLLRDQFPGHPLSVRVVSRGLRDSFLLAVCGAEHGSYRAEDFRLDCPEHRAAAVAEWVARRWK